MQSFDDEEQEGAETPTASSENERDEAMEDAGENDLRAEGDAAGKRDNEADAGNDDNAGNDENDPFTDSPSISRPAQKKPVGTDQLPSQQQNGLPSSQDSDAFGPAAPRGDTPTKSQPPAEAAPTSQPNPSVLLTSPSPLPPAKSPVTIKVPSRPNMRPEAVTATVYDIVPTIAAPHSTSINAVTTTPDLRWVFTGGADGYIRKFNWVETANGKVMLTVAQRHPFVDSVTKAGVLMSYWENEEPQVKSSYQQASDDNLALSPVYSLAVHSQGLWLLSGLDSGGINLQSIRHDEGKRITCLRQHTSAVSALTLAEDEKSVLSGSWDKNVFDWDLNTGQTKRSFDGSGGQISAIQARPMSSLPVPALSADMPLPNGTMSSNNADRASANGILPNGTKKSEDAKAEAASPTDSLFGGNDGDSLFGDDDGTGPAAPSGGNFGEEDDDDDFSRAIANGIQQEQDEEPALAAEAKDVEMADAAPPPSTTQPETDDNPPTSPLPNGTFFSPSKPASSATLTNGLPRSEEDPRSLHTAATDSQPPATTSATSETTFLAASFDGTLRIWDKRQPMPVACILPRNVPPWCMNACWSPSGNSIYAGRRNGTVEEYSLHKGLQAPDRVFKFPNGSGPVSAVKAMPNGRHLICASFDILRLYDLQSPHAGASTSTSAPKPAGKPAGGSSHSTVPFLIVPGHRGGVISSLYLDPTCRYLISTAGNRGWEGSTTEVLLGYEIGAVQP